MVSQKSTARIGASGGAPRLPAVRWAAGSVAVVPPGAGPAAAESRLRRDDPEQDRPTQAGAAWVPSRSGSPRGGPGAP